MKHLRETFLLLVEKAKQFLATHTYLKGYLIYVTKEGEKILLLDTAEEGINSADICYIPSKKMLLVPAMLNNKLIAYTLSY